MSDFNSESDNEHDVKWFDGVFDEKVANNYDRWFLYLFCSLVDSKKI